MEKSFCGSFKAIRKNKILMKTSGFTVHKRLKHYLKVNIIIIYMGLNISKPGSPWDFLPDNAQTSLKTQTIYGLKVFESLNFGFSC